MTTDSGTSAPAIRTRALRKVFPLPKPAKGAMGGASGPGGGGAGASGATGSGAAGAPGGATPFARPAGNPSGAAPTEVVALDALDLEVRSGEFFGLLGPNGAGKTTTIGVLTTRVKPTAGGAAVSGFDVVRDSVAVKQRIGVVPQRPNADHSLSVRENLVFHASYFGIPVGLATTHAQRLLEYFGLGDRANAKPMQLSGGQQQRLMIARALMHEPEVLFLDEPTVGLDPQSRLALWDVLREMSAQGRTVVMTTHYMEEADRLCERVAIVDQGRLLALDTPGALKSRAPGGTLVQLTLDGDAAASAETARATPGLIRIEALGPRLTAYAERPGEVISALLRAAEQSGRLVRDVHLSPPSLETLFVSLTGRSLE
ncbi:MAG: ABC transporter ATP-binding protein [Candidatus Eisenbacteria bacterium]